MVVGKVAHVLALGVRTEVETHDCVTDMPDHVACAQHMFFVRGSEFAAASAAAFVAAIRAPDARILLYTF